MKSAIKFGAWFATMMLAVGVAVLMVAAGWSTGSWLVGVGGTVVGTFFGCISVAAIGDHILDMD